MAVTEGSIGTPSPEGTGKALDTAIVTTGVGSVHREAVFLGDAETPAARTRITNAAPAAGDYGPAVRMGDGHSVALGATTDAEAAAGNGSAIAILKRFRTLLNGGLPAALVGGRLDVSIGAAIAAGANRIGKVTIRNAADAADIDPLSEATFAARMPAALVGGRLDDNVGSWMGSTAATVGQKAMASSLPVALASDQAVIPVNGDVDHDAVNTLKQIQVAGNARAVDDPPTAVSAVGDRVRAWYDRFGSPVVRRRKIRESYTAVGRLAEAASRLDQTFTQVANTNKQWCTLHHAASATKEIRLQRCWVYITSDTVAGIQGVIELRELSVTTPPASGNPAITPRAHRIGTGAAEATCLYLPGTQGSEAAVNGPLGHVPFDTGISAGTSTVNPVPILVPVVLYDASQEDDEVLPPTAPVGVYGGWAVMVRTVGVPVLRITVVWKFTEEIP